MMCARPTLRDKVFLGVRRLFSRAIVAVKLLPPVKMSGEIEALRLVERI
jgi:hypothetical protein